MSAQSVLKSISSLVIKCTVKINGGQVADSVGISSIKVTHEVNRISSAELSLITLTGKAADHGFVPGNKIEIDAGYAGGEVKSLFKGIVVKNSISIDSFSNFKWSVSCKHSVSEMASGRETRVFRDVTDSKCIADIFEKYGIDVNVKPSEVKQAELFQGNASDWNFILTRTEALGYIICPDTNPIFIGPPKLNVSEGVKRVAVGESVISFSAEINGENLPPSVTATAWDKKEGADNIITATAPAINGRMVKLPDSYLKQPQNLMPIVPMAQNEMQAWADGRLLRITLGAFKGQVTVTGTPGIETGNLIELAGVGEDYTGLAFVSSISHTIAKGSWKTLLKLGLEDFQTHEKVNISSPPAGGQLPAKHGLQRATVTKLEKDPSNEFNIQVQTQPSTKDGNDSIWARIASNYATASAGVFIMPELNDEVVVGFLDEDPRHPIVLGSLYSSTNPPPYTVKDTNYTKMLCTKAKLKITFDDEKKSVTIETPGNNKIVLSDEAKSIELTDQNNNSVKMTQSGINLQSGKDITIKADGDISLTSTSGKISVSATAGDVSVSGNNITESATMGFKATGNASAQVSSSATTTIKGTLVLIN